MAGFTRINMVLFLMLELQFTAVTVQVSYLIVREGHDVTLPCESLGDAQNGCDETRWLFVHPDRPTAIVVLVRDGQIERREISKSKSNRLSVTEKCSLVMKVTFEDIGQYTCRHRGQDSQVELSVVIMTEQKHGDNVTLNCYVPAFSCRHKVKWLYQGQNVDKNTNQQTSQSDCQATLSFLDSHFISPSRYKLLTCEVTNYAGGKVEFSFRRQTSGDDKMPDPDPPGWWRFIIVSVGLATLIIIVVTVNIWTRTKGNKPQMDNTSVHSDEEDGTVTYENHGDPSVSVRLH